MAGKVGPLTDLEKHEEVIFAQKARMVEAGAALRIIKQRQLYRGTHYTFDAYCRDVFGIDPRDANEYMRWAEEEERAG